MSTIVITHEEKKLLDTAKALCQHLGHANGCLIRLPYIPETQIQQQLIDVIDAGHQVVDGKRVFEIKWDDWKNSASADRVRLDPVRKDEAWLRLEHMVVWKGSNTWSES